MADAKELGLFQSALVKGMNPQNDISLQLAQEYKTKDSYYRNLLGNDFVEEGLRDYGPQFFTLVEQELQKNPNIVASLHGSSGNFILPQNGLAAGVTPVALNARLGIEQNGLRGGVSTGIAKTPSSYMQMPTMYDVGYNTNLFGGNLDIGAGYSPKTNISPTSYNIQAMYKKQF